MPPAARDDLDDEPVRRSVVPQRAARSLWLAAAWTGAGTAVVAAIAAVGAVAVLWLPAAGSAGSAGSAVRAGLLTFLAGVHGGITVDGLASDFVPLGLTLALAALAWRAGSGLADVADDLDETEPSRLLAAAAMQAAVFALACAVLGRLATLGTSSVPAFGVTLAAFVLFLLVAGAAFVRWSPLGAGIPEILPGRTGSAGRAAVAVLAVYAIGGALLSVGSLVAHHSRVETLSHQVGGGWSGVPILVLGALAAPNAVVAGGSYLAGPGFAVGDGNSVSLWSGAHGVVPAFPILAGLPSGPAGAAAWILAVLTFLAAGGCVGALLCAGRSLHGAVPVHPAWTDRFGDLLRAAALTTVVAAFAAWQAGGAIGSGRLAAVGASPWQTGLSLGAITVVAGGLGLAAVAAAEAWRARRPAAAPLQALAQRANAAAEALESTHRQVAVEDDGVGRLRATLRSVTAAVVLTDAERDDEPRAERRSDDVRDAGTRDEPVHDAHSATAPLPRTTVDHGGDATDRTDTERITVDGGPGSGPPEQRAG